MDWKTKAKKEYIAGGISFRGLASKYGVTLSAVRAAAKAGCWVQLRAQARAKSDSKIVESVAEASRRRAERVQTIADKLLDKIERSLGELDLVLAKETYKVRELEYGSAGGGKPTKETVSEQEKMVAVSTIVDRKGLRELTAALRDLKEVQMLRSEMDQREQAARIASLEEKSKPAEDGGITVRFEGGMEEFSG